MLVLCPDCCFSAGKWKAGEKIPFSPQRPSLGTSAPTEAMSCQTQKIHVPVSPVQGIREWGLWFRVVLIWFSFFYSNPFEWGGERGVQVCFLSGTNSVSVIFEKGRFCFLYYMSLEQQRGIMFHWCSVSLIVIKFLTVNNWLCIHN